MLAFAALLALFSLVSAAPPNLGSPDRCASHRTDQQKADAEVKYSSKQVNSMDHAARTGPIPVYWHVIYAGNNYDQGYVPRKQVEDSISTLNRAFAPTGMKYNLANVTWTQSPEWYNSASIGNTQQTQMKQRLRVGDERTLNVYTVKLDGYLGYATFPSDYDDTPYDDGVVVRWNTLPGGSMATYNLGMTLVHEVGHWVGLYHTFQGGCSGQGDMVSDTPASASPSRGCPVNRDSCPWSAGKDPVNNYMDYSDDRCLNNFTPGQIRRLKDQIRTFRDIDL